MKKELGISDEIPLRVEAKGKIRLSDEQVHFLRILRGGGTYDTILAKRRFGSDSLRYLVRAGLIEGTMMGDSGIVLTPAGLVWLMQRSLTVSQAKELNLRLTQAW